MSEDTEALRQQLHDANQQIMALQMHRETARKKQSDTEQLAIHREERLKQELLTVQTDLKAAKLGLTRLEGQKETVRREKSEAVDRAVACEKALLVAKEKLSSSTQSNTRLQGEIQTLRRDKDELEKKRRTVTNESRVFYARRTNFKRTIRAMNSNPNEIKSR